MHVAARKNMRNSMRRHDARRAAVQGAKRALAAGSPLRSVRTGFLECRRRNKPSEISFDSRRGATLETFSSRSERSGLGADDEPRGPFGQAIPGDAKALCGFPLSPTIIPPLGMAPL